MYAYFDVDEPTVLRVRKAVNEGKIKRYQEGKIPVYMGLQGEEGFPHQGTLNFVNNQVNPATGSILVRGVFPNPIPASGTTRVLSPGMFVRIRLPIGQPHPALLVIDRAIGSDQGLKYVYVVNKDNKVEYRRVTTGALQDDGMRVILSGLKADESVVVGGLQLVRPNMEIQPDRMPMPALDQAPDDIDKKGKVQPDPADPKPQDGETKSEKQGEKAEPKEKAQPSGEKAEAK
jgi:multidrug efflux system membrane fusion protein